MVPTSHLRTVTVEMDLGMADLHFLSKAKKK